MKDKLKIIAYCLFIAFVSICISLTYFYEINLNKAVIMILTSNKYFIMYFMLVIAINYFIIDILTIIKKYISNLTFENKYKKLILPIFITFNILIVSLFLKHSFIKIDIITLYISYLIYGYFKNNPKFKIK